MPVTDLTREDFEVREDDVVQRVQLFQHISLSGQPPAGSDESLAIRSPDHARQEAARDDVRLLVIFLDDYHLKFGAIADTRLRQDLVHFVQTDDASARPVRGDGAADADFRSRPDARQKRGARAHQQGAGASRRLRAAAQPDRGSAHAAGRRRPHPHSRAGDPVGARVARRASGRPARRPQVDPLCEPGTADAARRRRPVRRSARRDRRRQSQQRHHSHARSAAARRSAHDQRRQRRRCRPTPAAGASA